MAKVSCLTTRDQRPGRDDAHRSFATSSGDAQLELADGKLEDRATLVANQPAT